MLELWQYGTHLLARLELQIYHERREKGNLIRSQAHFEAAFPILHSLRSHQIDDALQDDLVNFFQQVKPMTAKWCTWARLFRSIPCISVPQLSANSFSCNLSLTCRDLARELCGGPRSLSSVVRPVPRCSATRCSSVCAHRSVIQRCTSQHQSIETLDICG